MRRLHWIKREKSQFRRKKNERFYAEGTWRLAGTFAPPNTNSRRWQGNAAGGSGCLISIQIMGRNFLDPGGVVVFTNEV